VPKTRSFASGSSYYTLASPESFARQLGHVPIALAYPPESQPDGFRHDPVGTTAAVGEPFPRVTPSRPMTAFGAHVTRS